MSEITSIPVPDSQYNEVVILDEYNGVYSIIQGKAGDERNFWRMCYPQTKQKQPGSKPIQMKVTLGDRNTAAWMLRKLADTLDEERESESYPPPDTPQGDDNNFNDDLPF